MVTAQGAECLQEEHRLFLGGAPESPGLMECTEAPHRSLAKGTAPPTCVGNVSGEGHIVCHILLMVMTRLLMSSDVLFQLSQRAELKKERDVGR